MKMSEMTYLLNYTQLKIPLNEAENEAEDGNRIRFVFCNVIPSDRWNAKIKI